MAAKKRRQKTITSKGIPWPDDEKKKKKKKRRRLTSKGIPWPQQPKLIVIVR